MFLYSDIYNCEDVALKPDSLFEIIRGNFVYCFLWKQPGTSIEKLHLKFAEWVFYAKIGCLFHDDIFCQYIDWSLNVHAEHWTGQSLYWELQSEPYTEGGLFIPDEKLSRHAAQPGILPNFLSPSYSINSMCHPWKKGWSCRCRNACRCWFTANESCHSQFPDNTVFPQTSWLWQSHKITNFTFAAIICSSDLKNFQFCAV